MVKQVSGVKPWTEYTLWISVSHPKLLSPHTRVNESNTFILKINNQERPSYSLDYTRSQGTVST